MKTAHFLSSDLNTSQDLSLSALDNTFTIGRKRKLEMICFHASVAISENIVITLDSALGSDYDVKLADVVLVAETDYVFRPQGECNLQSGDSVKVTCTNANETGTLFCSLKTSEL